MPALQESEIRALVAELLAGIALEADTARLVTLRGLVGYLGG